MTRYQWSGWFMFWAAAGFLLGAILLVGCGPSPTAPSATFGIQATPPTAIFVDTAGATELEILCIPRHSRTGDF